jgi:hypothetical protein
MAGRPYRLRRAALPIDLPQTQAMAAALVLAMRRLDWYFRLSLIWIATLVLPFAYLFLK